MKSMFSLETLRKNYSLVPLLVIVGSGVLAGVAFTVRSALKHPDVSWNKKDNPEPWQAYKDKQFKLYSTKDFATLPTEDRPPIFDEKNEGETSSAA